MSVLSQIMILSVNLRLLFQSIYSQTMKNIFTILLFLVICITSPAQLYINEFMASNSSTIKDPDYNADADWIELYNDGSSSINLQGYYLTDKLDIPNKWARGCLKRAVSFFFFLCCNFKIKELISCKFSSFFCIKLQEEDQNT